MIWWQKKPFVDVIEGYDKISIREQKIVLVTVTVILVMLGYLLVIEPLLLSNKVMFDEHTSILNVNASLDQQIQKTRERQYQDPNEPLREKLIEIRREGEEFQKKINFLTQALVAPKQMVNLLERVLTQDKQMKLISLRNLPEQAMNIQGNTLRENSGSDQADKTAEALIYKHVFEIELEATYGSTVSYLKRLDDLPWQLFWQRLGYESTEYPKGRLKIKIYTLSTSKEVLGV
jgi:MSHA biogenesis protein MshJ